MSSNAADIIVGLILVGASVVWLLAGRPGDTITDADVQAARQRHPSSLR